MSSNSTIISKNAETLQYFANDYRTILANYNVKKDKYARAPMMTRYEMALIVGFRATQIASGAETAVDVKPGMSEVDIALEELRQRKCPVIIKRTIGEVEKYYKPEDMTIKDI